MGPCSVFPFAKWSSWYGFTNNINEALFRDIGDGLVSSGLAAAGFTGVWIDDGYALPRDNVTQKVSHRASRKKEKKHSGAFRKGPCAVRKQ